MYPEIPDAVVSEVWHGEKWRRDFPLHALSPMYDAGDRHYYVNELARLRSGDYILPFRWVIFRKEVHAQAYPVSITEGIAAVNITAERLVSVTNLADNYYDLESKGLLPAQWNGESMFDLLSVCLHINIGYHRTTETNA